VIICQVIVPLFVIAQNNKNFKALLSRLSDNTTDKSKYFSLPSK